MGGRSAYLACWAVACAACAGGGARGSPQRIAAGDVVAANLSDHSVSLHDGATGLFQGWIVAPGGGLLVNATGVAFGPDGDLYVSSSGTDRILRFDGATGAPRGVFAEGDPLRRPFSLAFLPGGDLVVSSGDVVLRYGPDGGFVGYAARDTALSRPIGLAVGSDGLLYVANSGRQNVARFDPGPGRLVDVFAEDSLAFPSDVAFGPDGHLYVSSATGRRVVTMDGRTGGFVGIAADLGPDGVPVGVAFHSDGRMFVADFGAGRLWAGRPGAVEVVSSEGLAGPENIAIRPGG